MKIPDLLNMEPYLGIDYVALKEIFGLAFLGRELGTQVHDHLAHAHVPSGAFRPEFFATDLFVREMLDSSFTLEIGRRTYPVNSAFLERALTHAPADEQTILERQGVLRELDERDDTCRATYELYGKLFDLMSLLKTPGYTARLDTAAFHLDILRQCREVIDHMADAFAGSQSMLRRLHEVATESQQTSEYRTLAQLSRLPPESGMARMKLEVTIGGDGKIRDFSILDLKEAEENPNHSPPLRRLINRWSLGLRGYPMSNKELTNRLINEVFRELSPHIIPMVQLMGHLEFYLTARKFRDRCRGRGLQVCLPEFGEGPVEYRDLFNPLLVEDVEPPVPSQLHAAEMLPIFLITGPNSGGKTRLLQSIGLTQVLGQSGLYVPCSHALLRVQDGLFVSLIEEEGAHQTEGRLGRELMRIRSLFEELAPRSMVILDELCSGTNPSEGVEVFSMVLQLLRQVQPTAFVTTHFLDFARSLESEPVVDGLEFLQVEIDDDLASTYQFSAGVAATSLAAITAKRLGVTFENLSKVIRAPEPAGKPTEPANPAAGVETSS